MKFTTSALIEVIDQTIARMEKREEEYDAAHAEWVKSERERWMTETLPKLQSLRDEITACVKNRRPLTREVATNALQPGRNTYTLEVPTYSAYEGKSKHFKLNGKEYSRPAWDRNRLESLRSCLHAVAEEEVTTSALASLGYRNLQWLFEAAARADA